MNEWESMERQLQEVVVERLKTPAYTLNGKTYENPLVRRGVPVHSILEKDFLTTLELDMQKMGAVVFVWPPDPSGFNPRYAVPVAERTDILVNVYEDAMYNKTGLDVWTLRSEVTKILWQFVPPLDTTRMLFLDENPYEKAFDENSRQYSIKFNLSFKI